MTDKLNYRYETLEIGEMEVHMRSLRDMQEFQDDEHIAEGHGISDGQWPLFGIIWPASFVLATLMEKRDFKKLKILEVGCGLGLASLVLKMRGADITATDYNPAVKTFLAENTRINKCDDIDFVRADWQDKEIDSLLRYDLIIGSDLLYQRDHPAQLAHFIDKYAQETCEVIIVGPNRGHLNQFIREMQTHQFANSSDEEQYLERFSIPFKGRVNYFYR